MTILYMHLISFALVILRDTYEVKLFFLTVCADDEFECKYGECIPLDNVCNGVGECLGDKDEENCTGKIFMFICYRNLFYLIRLRDLYECHGHW